MTARTTGARVRAGAAAVLLAGVLAACSPGAPSADEPGADDDASGPTARAEPTEPTGPNGPAAPRPGPGGDDGRSHRVLAVGDVACAPGEEPTATTCRHAEVAELTASLDPEAVLLLGDLQYEGGSAEDFAGSFDRSWGRLGDRLRPVPGNHEYRTPGAAGYVDYVTTRGLGPARGYERFAVGRWSVYAVNSNCDEIACGPQVRWLERELARDTRCSLLYLHHPRYSTGEHGPDPMAEPFFTAAYDAGVELVISGHDHHYERFAPMDDEGRTREGGTVQYVSGAGGKSHYVATGDATGSTAVVDDEFGVLQLDLGARGWSSVFVGLEGKTDRYAARCHGS